MFVGVLKQIDFVLRNLKVLSDACAQGIIFLLFPTGFPKLFLQFLISLAAKKSVDVLLFDRIS